MGKTFRPSLNSDENFFTDEVVDSGERYHKWHSEVVVGLHHWQLTATKLLLYEWKSLGFLCNLFKSLYFIQHKFYSNNSILKIKLLCSLSIREVTSSVNLTADMSWRCSRRLRLPLTTSIFPSFFLWLLLLLSHTKKLSSRNTKSTHTGALSCIYLHLCFSLLSQCSKLTLAFLLTRGVAESLQQQFTDAFLHEGLAKYVYYYLSC